VLARIRSIFRNSGARLDEELEAHLDALAAAHRQRGLSPEEALRAARRDLGGLTRIRELHREQRRIALLDTFAQDVRYAFRQLRASPGFTAAAVLTLALGIGANTAIYRVLDAAVFRSLPVKDPQRLVQLQLWRDGKPARFSYPLFREMAARERALDGMFAASGFPLHQAVLRGSGPLKTLRGVLVSGDYFQVLGVAARVGRVFTAEDDRAAAPVAVISDAFWESEFQRSPDALGKPLEINKAVVTIVGIAPRGFFGETLGKTADAWLPMSLQPQVMATDWLNAPESNWLSVIGRLPAGVSDRQAESALEAVYRQAAGGGARPATRFQVQLQPAGRGIDELRNFAHPLWLLMGIVGLVLLIACCNLANLLLGRAAARTHEIGVRLALGAGRARLVRQLLTESLLLAAAGSLLALAVAWRASQALLVMASGAEQFQLSLDWGWRATAFTAAIAVAATVLFGAAPALIATRIEVNAALQGARRGVAGSPSRHLAGRALIAAQISVSLLLLTGAALLVQSLWNLRHQDFGFQAGRVLTVNLPIEFNKTMMERNKRVLPLLYDRLNALPGVRAAALSAFGPMAGIQHTVTISLPERPYRDTDYTRFVHITPQYFEAMGVRIVAGRGITADDRAGAPKVAVLSQTAARTLFGDGDPLGRIISGGRTFDARGSLRVVGVAHDVRFLPRDPYGALVYVPFTQEPAPATEALLETAGDPTALAGAVRAAIRDIDPSLPVGEIRSLADQVDQNLSHEKMMAALSACFGLVALALTCIGVYGVVSYAVKGRAHEIGVRIALGARRRQVALALVKGIAWPAGASLLAGGAACIALRPAIRSQLFGIAPHDLSMLAASAALIVCIAGLAAYLPARRAAQLDPMQALREE
jgi:predicted permease